MIGQTFISAPNERAYHCKITGMIMKVLLDLVLENSDVNYSNGKKWQMKFWIKKRFETEDVEPFFGSLIFFISLLENESKFT